MVPPTSLAPVVLEGRHARLEPLALDHLPDLTAVGLDPDLWRWLLESVHGADDLRRYVERALAERDRWVSLPFATVECPRGRAVGSTRYGNIALEHRQLEIGWTWIPQHLSSFHDPGSARTMAVAKRPTRSSARQTGFVAYRAADPKGMSR